MRSVVGVVLAILVLAAFWLGAADRTVAPHDPQIGAKQDLKEEKAVPPAPAHKAGAGGVSSWSSFRGATHGVSAHTNAPVDWDGASSKGVLWKTALKQSGVGSPVLWGDRIFLTEGDDHERAVLAFDAATGKELWRKLVSDGAAGTPLPSYPDSGLALNTAACDAHGVYALFGTGDLAAFTHDGAPLWQVFLKRPVIGYGYSSSPCVLNNLVCVQLDDHTGGRITAVDTLTGKVKWEAERSRGASWSSPLVIPGPGPERKPVVVVNANGSVSAYDETGKMVWDADGVTGEVTPSPAYWDGKLYPVHNGSGLLCYDVTAAEPKKLFEYHGTLCDVASPVIANGLLFMASGSGQMSCIDALTGKEMWTHDCPGCYASLVASGERVYCLGRDGTTLIVAAERQFRLIGSPKLGEGSDSTPALGNGQIYIRSRKALWCLGH